MADQKEQNPYNLNYSLNNPGLDYDINMVNGISNSMNMLNYNSDLALAASYLASTCGGSTGTASSIMGMGNNIDIRSETSYDNYSETHSSIIEQDNFQLNQPIFTQNHANQVHGQGQVQSQSTNSEVGAGVVGTASTGAGQPPLLT